MGSIKIPRRSKSSSGTSVSPSEYRDLLINAIRQVWSYFSPERQSVIKKYRIEIPLYNKDGSLSKKVGVRWACHICGTLVPAADRDIDHVKPIGTPPPWPPNGDGAWERYLMAVHCPEDNLKPACKKCNRSKGKNETI